MANPSPPFTATYSPNVPELMNTLGCTIVLSTYQAGKVICLSAMNNDNLIQLPRTFDNAMGLATDSERIAVACKTNVQVLKNSPSHAPTYPAKAETYDSLFLPRATYYTGQLALHDMHWGPQGLVAVNTMFSCLSTITPEYGFEPMWKPPFISELIPEDRCHLNGMAINKGVPEYVTALGDTNVREGWRENKMNGGVLMHVPSGEILVRGLAMPHSPRIFDNKLYVLNSAQGDLLWIDPENGKTEVVCKLGGFARGMARCGDYLFIGVSKLRHQNKVFGDLPIAKTSFAGVVIVYLPYGSTVGAIKYETSVEEIYDVKILFGLRRPNILSPDKEEHKLALYGPRLSYWAVPDTADKTTK